MTKNKESSQPRSLITGITGFAGSHMAELLLDEGHQVYGTMRWRSRTENIKHIEDKLNLIEADLLDLNSLEEAVFAAKPDYIFHLAAQSFVPASWTSPAVTLETNVTGSCNLFEAVRAAQIDPVIQIACSSEEYGLVKPDEVPMNEDNPLRPMSPYAVSKVGLDFLGYQYYKSYDMKIVRTRGFNHTGPRRGDVFVVSTFAKQIAEIEAGKKEPVMKVGNLQAKRDFTDVRDMVKGYYLAAKKGEPGEVYNIATGESIEIKKMLDMLLEMSKVDDIKVEKDPKRMRPSDVPILEGDASKFKKATGWEPEVPFEKTLKDILQYWRENV